MRNNSKIKVNSNRSFGIVFFFVFLIISLWPLTNENPLRVWSVFVAIIFFTLPRKKPEVNLVYLFHYVTVKKLCRADNV